jgi:hypothetical protein
LFIPSFSQVPLKVSLYYHKGPSGNHAYVNEQDILKQNSDGQRNIGADGCTTLKIRIEDVSKNHRTQPFCVKVEPDTQQNPNVFDISGDYSGPVTVKSKRTKRQRRAAEGGDPRGAMGGSAAYDQGLGMSGMSGTPPAMGMGVPMHPSHVPSSNLAEDAALSGVIQWAGMVVSTLQALQWQQIGYECAQDRSGSVDIDKPIYRCVTFTQPEGTSSQPPNIAINQLLTTYAQETMGHLHNLLKAIEGMKQGKNGDLGPGGALGVIADAATDGDAMDTSGGGGADAGGAAGGGLLGPPQMQRSSTLDFLTNMDMPDMKRGQSFGLGALMPPPPVGGMAGGAAESGEENGVYYILAKMYSQKDTGDVGFPAFNKDNELLGFYREEQVAVGNGEYTTQCKVRRARQCGGSVHGGIYSVYRSFTN